MVEEVSVKAEELVRLYRALARVRYFLHRPDAVLVDEICDFRAQVYQELHDLEYDVVWNWLPEELQETLMEE